MKRILILIIVTFCAVWLCSCQNSTIPHENEITDDEITYVDTSRAMFSFEVEVEKCEEIIIGTVQSTQEVTMIMEGDWLHFASLSNIEVIEVISGNAQVGDIIPVWESGNGRTEIYRDIIKTGGYLEASDKCLLLLHIYDENSSVSEDLRRNNLEHLIPSYTFHPYHGRIWLDENGEIDLERNAYQFSFVIQDESEMMYSSSEGRTTDSQEGTRTARQGETLDEFIGRIEAALADERSVAEIAGDVGVGEARREE